MSITIEEIVKSIIASDLHIRKDVTTEVTVEYALDDYEDSLSSTLHTLGTLPIDCTKQITCINRIFTILTDNYELIESKLIDYIKLQKLEKIL